MKKTISLILALMLCMLVPMSSIAEAADPVAQLAGSYFTYAFTAEGYGDYVYYFHFYEEVPVLGSVFYAGFGNNQMNFAGTYTVEEKEYAYTCHPDRTAATSGVYEEGVAPYTITFYDWTGAVLDSCGYDGSKLYNAMTVISGSGSGPLIYHRDEDPANSKYLTSYEDEVGVNYLSFISPEDETCTVQLSHNGTYVDLMSYIIEGKWEMIAREDGGYDYALTPDDATEKPASISVSTDRMTAVYTDGEGIETELVNMEAGAAALVYVGTGVQPFEAYATEATFVLNMFDDGTCALIMTLFGSEGDLDVGTYTMNEDHSISFEFDKAGDLTAVLNMETFASELTYVLAHDQLGEINVLLTLGRPAVEAEAAVLFSFTGTYTTLDIYDDGTYVFAFESYGLQETGTWAFDAAAYAFTMTQSNGNVLTGSIDGQSHALVVEYTAEANEQLKDTFTCESAVWGTALVK